jgi:hypothetical protein
VSGDIVERLRSQHSDLRQGAYYSQREDSAWDATADAADEIERFRAELDAIDALHQPIILGACRQCNCMWPCQTHVLLHPEEARHG